ncbi:type II toxin-antitoxin system RelE/ParE family toxin [Solimicrobium silvestre]|uniref:Plasmid stabilization system protein n=1 Tax=Solimicrobium silvestre TaxID=2099400 RepID=A0A2S9GXG3_9BURK|nr:type II toxin-antitoxin system RelE/ParE family toxin [Solimicrobium silvestre]PRC92409.1 Plasmid stabilization system protein [Solimicrobium silvestre]
MRIKFLEQAKADLAEHNDYYRKLGGVALASKMMDRIKGPVLALKDNPAIAQSYELAPDMRRLVVARGAFLVFYRVDVDIEVLHILRAERIPLSDPE